MHWGSSTVTTSLRGVCCPSSSSLPPRQMPPDCACSTARLPTVCCGPSLTTLRPRASRSTHAPVPGEESRCLATLLCPGICKLGNVSWAIFSQCSLFAVCSKLCRTHSGSLQFHSASSTACSPNFGITCMCSGLCKAIRVSAHRPSISC